MSDLGAHVGTKVSCELGWVAATSAVLANLPLVQYAGEAHNHRMEGKGEYTFEDGVVYKGEFHDGMFHGKGSLHYPNGGVYTSTWHEGKEVQGEYTFHDGLEFGGKAWDYVTPSDRRFFTERKDGIKPSGDTALRDRPDKPDVPEGCFDMGNGMHLDPTSGSVVLTSSGEVLRAASKREVAWATTKTRENKGSSGPAASAQMQQVHAHFAPVPGHGPATGKATLRYTGAAGGAD